MSPEIRASSKGLLEGQLGTARSEPCRWGRSAYWRLHTRSAALETPLPHVHTHTRTHAHDLNTQLSS